MESNITDRLVFLAEKFEIFELEFKDLKDKVKELNESGFEVSVLEKNQKVLALTLTKFNGHEKAEKIIRVSSDVFSAIVEADPTQNKSCVQWMLNVFVRLIKQNAEAGKDAIRFVTEDLPLANSYITLFEGNKRKVKFKRLSSTSPILKHMVDPTDINQYKSLAQLYDAVDPFIERNPGEIESLLLKYVTAGEAEIPVRDRKFTVFIPKTKDANAVFESYANWCTAKLSNTMFASYTGNNLKPNGKKSDIYIVIDNRFFTGESSDIYQIHFETGQIKGRENNENINLYEKVLQYSEALTNYFHDELLSMAKESKATLDDNKYLETLVKIGFADSLFEVLEEDTPQIKFEKRQIPKLPDISKFKFLDTLIMVGSGLVEIHPSIGKLKNLNLLSLPKNNIRTLPKEIGGLKNLTFLNLTGSKLENIPDEIKYLDTSNGGSLYRIAVSKKDIGEENYFKLRRLLPNALMRFDDDEKENEKISK